MSLPHRETSPSPRVVRKEGIHLNFQYFSKRPPIDPRPLPPRIGGVDFFCIFRIVLKLWAKRSVENLRGIFLKSFKSGPGRLGNEEGGGGRIFNSRLQVFNREPGGIW